MPIFPDPQGADDTGLVAVSHDLTPALLLAASRQGIFPWTDDPVGWFSPNPRALVLRQHLHLPRNLGKLARRGGLRATYDRAFVDVMRGCAQAHRHAGVWITPRFIAAYSALHLAGWAHSVEIWHEDRLVGGLYGVQAAPGLFAGESMFSQVPNASKLAFAALWSELDRRGIDWMDAQVVNPHTERLGARPQPRSAFLQRVRAAVAADPHLVPPGTWATEPQSAHPPI